MSDTRIASRYAKSILELGIEQKKLDTLYGDMTVLNEALANRDFKLFIKSPIINADKKQRVFTTIFGEQLDEISKSFFSILTRKGREFYLPEIVESFIHQYKKHNKITEVKLTTATQMGTAALEKIKKVLEDSKITDETVEIETSVDPDIIGGFVIELEDKLYDASVAHKLDQVRKNFKDANYIKSF